MPEPDEPTTEAGDEDGESPPVACTLDEAAAEQRRTEAQNEFFPLIEDVAELERGYVFTLTGEAETIDQVAAWIRAEAACCAFATYEMTVEPDLAAVELRVTGPEGTKDLYREGVVEAFGFDSIEDVVAAG